MHALVTSDFIWEPVFEGRARLKLATDPSCDGYDRAVHRVVGISLMIPIVGQIIWAAWNRLGAPESLANHLWLIPTPPRVPEVEVAPPAAIEPPVLEEVAQAAAPEVREPEVREYDDISWRVVRGDDGSMVVAGRYKNLNITSQGTYQEGRLQQLLREEENTLVKMELVGDRVTATCGTVSKTHTLKFAWIQQPTWGFRPFFESPHTELDYCMINPKEGTRVPFLDLVQMKMRKTRPGEAEFFGVVPWTPEMASRAAFLGRVTYDVNTFVIQTIRTEGWLGVNENSTLLS